MCRIDLNDPTLGGAWLLSDGTLPLYTNWNIQYKQPNNEYGGEYYVILNAGGAGPYDGSWFDAPDGSFAHALCNLPQPPPPPPPLLPLSSEALSIGGVVGGCIGGVVVVGGSIVLFLWLCGAFGSKCPSPLKRPPLKRQAGAQTKTPDKEVEVQAA